MMTSHSSRVFLGVLVGFLGLHILVFDSPVPRSDASPVMSAHAWPSPCENGVAEPTRVVREVHTSRFRAPKNRASKTTVAPARGRAREVAGGREVVPLGEKDQEEKGPRLRPWDKAPHFLAMRSEKRPSTFSPLRVGSERKTCSDVRPRVPHPRHAILHSERGLPTDPASLSRQTGAKPPPR